MILVRREKLGKKCVIPAADDPGALVLNNLVVHLDSLDGLDLGNLDSNGLHDGAGLLNGDDLEKISSVSRKKSASEPKY